MLWFWSHLKLELSITFCSTNRPLYCKTFYGRNYLIKLECLWLSVTPNLTGRLLPCNPCKGGRISTTDFLVPTSSDQLLLTLKILFFCFCTNYLINEVNLTLPCPSVRVPRLYMARNRTAHICHQCKKITVLSCHICLINTGIQKMYKNWI